MKANLLQHASILALLTGCSGSMDPDARFFTGEEGADPVFDTRKDALRTRADLVTTLTGPGQGSPGATVRYELGTRNIGSRSAANTQATFTPPTGVVVAAVANGCTVLSAPSRVQCSLSTLNAGASKTRSIDVVLPVAPGPQAFSATATTTTAELSTSNNGSALTTTVAAPVYEPTLSLPQTLFASACYPATSYAECTPAALVHANLALLAGGIVDTFTPEVSGTYTQPNGPSSLAMEFRSSADQSWLSSFTGLAISDTCFQGTIVTASGPGAFEACLD